MTRRKGGLTPEHYHTEDGTDRCIAHDRRLEGGVRLQISEMAGS